MPRPGRGMSGDATLLSWGPPLQKQVAGSDKSSREGRRCGLFNQNLARWFGQSERVHVCVVCCACCMRVCAHSVCVVVPSPTEHPVRDLAPPPSSGSLIFQSGRPLAAPPRPPGPELEACAVEDAAEGPRGLGRLHTPGSLRSWCGTGGGSVGGRAPVRFPARDGGTG